MRHFKKIGHWGPVGGDIVSFKHLNDCILYNVFVIYTTFILYDRSPHFEQHCLLKHCCQSNCSLNICHYVKKLLLQSSPRFFDQSKKNTTLVQFTGLSRSIIICICTGACHIIRISSKS